MAPLLRVVLILAAFFAATFVLARLTGLFSVASITAYLEKAQSINPGYLFIIIVLLLFSDLFIAVPTLTITILSGYFLGFTHGSLAAISGMLLAGSVGYGLSWRYGEVLLQKIIKSDHKRKEAIDSFNRYGAVMILLSRVSPILPEVSACMAGMVRMGFVKFIAVWCLSTIPYSLIAAYSGSISSMNNPKPAIYAALSINFTLWVAWFLFKKYKHST